MVTLASDSPGPGALQKLRLALAERNIVADTSNEGRIAFQHKGVTAHAVANGLDLRQEMKRQIRDFKPDRTLISCEDPGQAILESALETGISPIVLLVQTTLPLPFGPGSFLASKQKTELLKSVNAIVANCRFLADYMLEWGGLNSTVIRFPAFGSPPFPQVTGADNGFVTLINPSAMKGISIFLELARSLPDVSFATVPTWGTTKADRDRLAELPNVKILEATDNIDAIFALTRVLLVPSLWSEAVGYIGIEAMLRGIPVMGSDVGGMREAKLGVDYLLPVTPITQFEDRFDERRLPVPIVPEQNTRPWREALVKLISDQDHYESLSRASREASLDFISQIRVENFEEFFESLQASPRASTAPSRLAVSDKQSMLDNLSPEKRALLALRLRRRAANTQETKQIPRRHATSAPLSFSQQRLWFLEQLEPNKAVYNIPAATQLSGKLDVEALTKALAQIVSRHEILRTTFAVVGPDLVQASSPDTKLSLEMRDLSSLSEVEQQQMAHQIMFDDAQQPFNLVKGPPLRAILLRFSDTEHVLLLTLHHIVSDGLVHRHSLSGVRCALRIVFAPREPITSRAHHSIQRFRNRATRTFREGIAAKGTGILAQATGRMSIKPRPPFRPQTTGGPLAGRRQDRLYHTGGSLARDPAARATTKCYRLHAVAGRFSDAALSIFQTRGHLRQLAHRRQEYSRDGKRNRVLHQHVGVSFNPLGGPHVPGIA